MSIIISDIIISLQYFKEKKTVTIAIFSKFSRSFFSLIHNDFVCSLSKKSRSKFDEKIISIINIILQYIMMYYSIRIIQVI